MLRPRGSGSAPAERRLRRAAAPASALARISSGDGSAASTSGGMSRSRLQRDQAVLALLERAVVVALLREARLRLGAAVAQHRVDVAAEQRRDVDLHRLAPHVVRLDLLAVDRPVAVLREHDRDFGADARAGRAVGLAVALVLHLNLAVRRDAVDVEQAEAQALHAVGAARVVDDREPRLPRCGGGRGRVGTALDRRRQRVGGGESSVGFAARCPRPARHDTSSPRSSSSRVSVARSRGAHSAAARAKVDLRSTRPATRLIASSRSRRSRSRRPRFEQSVDDRRQPSRPACSRRARRRPAVGARPTANSHFTARG